MISFEKNVAFRSKFFPEQTWRDPKKTSARETEVEQMQLLGSLITFQLDKRYRFVGHQ